MVYWMYVFRIFIFCSPGFLNTGKWFAWISLDEGKNHLFCIKHIELINLIHEVVDFSMMKYIIIKLIQSIFWDRRWTSNNYHENPKWWISRISHDFTTSCKRWKSRSFISFLGLIRLVMAKKKYFLCLRDNFHEKIFIIVRIQEGFICVKPRS